MNEEINQPNSKEQQKQQSRENVTNIGKEVGKKYLEANAIPPGLSDLAVNQMAKDPRVKMALNAVADNPIIKNNADRINRISNMSKGLGQFGAQNNRQSQLSSGSDEFKNMIGKAANPKKAATDALTGKDDKTDNSKLDTEKSLKEKETEKEEVEKEKGQFSLEFKKSTLIKLAIFCSCCGFVMIFFVALLSTLADNRAAALIMGTLVGEDKDLVKNAVESITDDNTGTSSLAIGRGDKNLDPYYERLSVLGNVFSSEVFNCSTVEECIKRPEFKYYLKVADISTRYKNKYGIKLDWILLNATILYSDVDEEKTMKRALNEYNEDDIDNNDILMNIDWNYDYKKIPGYNYLDPKDFRYDLQILAKNMVKKITNQTCTKCTTSADGTVTCVITKSRTDEDVEDQYLEPGQEYYLKCDSGESYSISSSYNLDVDKYDEFLLEYIEHKYYLPGVPGINADGTTDMTPSEATGEYIFPLAPGAARCRSSAYGYRYSPINGKYEWHSGDDYPAASGTPVYAVADGTVSSAANSGWNGGKGNFVTIDHGNGLQSIYMHASKVYVSAGDKVKKGDVIMGVGTTGSSTGNHLHITFKLNGNLQDPSKYIGSLSMCG